MSVGPLHLHCLVPGLFGPSAGLGRPGFPQPNTPGLAELIARASVAAVPRVPAGTPLVYGQFGYRYSETKDTSDAWLSYQADTGRVPSTPVLLAAPVHMRADRTRLVLFDAQSVGISRDEADALVAHLNHYLADQSLWLEYAQPERWYLHLSQSPQLRCTPLSVVLGQDVDPYLPRGSDARRWHAFLNEMQMALHAAEVNQRRADAGRPMLNSLWLWGGGEPLQPVAHTWQRIWADDAVSRALAALNTVPCSPVPESAEAWLQQVVGDRHLLVLESLQQTVAYLDVESWLQRIEDLDRRWFQPLRAALRSGRLQRLTLWTDDGQRIDINRWSIWKLWKRGRRGEGIGMDKPHAG